MADPILVRPREPSDPAPAAAVPDATTPITTTPIATTPITTTPIAPTRATTKPVKPAVKKASAAHYRQHRLADDPKSGDGTPLVLAFDDGHVDFNVDDVTFDFEPGHAMHSAWPSASTPWLVRDLDGSGAVESGRELFGSFTLLANGERAHNGFDALAELDENHDGVVDAGDAAFGSLLLWRDRNGDRRVEVGELESLAHAGVVELRLDHLDARRCDRRGNCERERAAFTWVDGAGEHRGAIIDVHLALGLAGSRS